MSGDDLSERARQPSIVRRLARGALDLLLVVAIFAVLALVGLFLIGVLGGLGGSGYNN